MHPFALLRRLAAYRWLLALALTFLALDQVTKAWCVRRFPFPVHLHDGRHDLAVVPGLFYFIHVGNTGAAWSVLDGNNALLALLALVALDTIFLFRRHLGFEHRVVQVSFGLLCGGIAGNLCDRVRPVLLLRDGLHGEIRSLADLRDHLAGGQVIDFLDFHFGSYIYPTFNVADSCIVCGVILYLFLNFFPPTPRR